MLMARLIVKVHSKVMHMATFQCCVLIKEMTSKMSVLKCDGGNVITIIA